MNTEYEPADSELLAMASQFDVYLADMLVRVAPRRYSGIQEWVAVNADNFIFNHDGGWEYQPVFPGQDDDYLYHTGWTDPKSLIAALRKSLEDAEQRQANLAPPIDVTANSEG